MEYQTRLIIQIPTVFNLNCSIDDAGDSDDVVMSLDDHHRRERFRPCTVHKLSNKDVLNDGLERQILTHLLTI